MVDDHPRSGREGENRAVVEADAKRSFGRYDVLLEDWISELQRSGGAVGVLNAVRALGLSTLPMAGAAAGSPNCAY